MTFIEQSTREKPMALYSLDDTAPFQDYSGFNLSGTTSGGTPETHLPLYKGAVESKIFNNSVNGIFPAPVFRQGHEDEPFSLEAWVRTINKTEGYEAQPYRENLAPNPAFNSSQSPRTSIARGTGTFAFEGYKISSDGGTSPTYIYIASGFGDIPTRIPISSGDRVGWNFKLRALRDLRLLVTGGAYKSDTSGTTSPTFMEEDADRFREVVSGEEIWIGTVGQFDAEDTAAMLPILYFYEPGSSSPTTAGDLVVLQKVIVENYGQNSERTDIPIYFDGDTPGYQWSGTPHQSASRPILGATGDINMIRNPSMDTNIGNWGSQGNAVISHETSNPITGSGSLKIERVAETANCYAIASTYDFIPQGYPILARFTVRNDSDNPAPIRVLFGQYSAGHYDVVDNPLLSPGEIRDVTLSRVATSNGIVMFYIGQGSGQGGTGDILVIDSVALGTQQYFDGNTPGAVWSGTPYDSYSYMLASNAEQQIIGNQNQLDGLLVNGTEVSFTTKYQSTTPATASYDTETSQVIHVIGTHTKDRNTLYVNGEKVAEESISIEQQNSLYPATGANLYSGQSASSQNIALGGVGVYAHALTQEEVSRHYDEGISVPSDEEVVTSNNGLRVQLSIDRANVFSTRVWSTESDWNSGVLDNVATNFDTLVPQFDSNVSLPGSWEDSFAISVPDVTSIYGVYLTWDGDGSVVEASLDGQTWESAEKGRNLNLIPSGFNPTDQELLIRISFPGGFADDESYISELTAVGFLTNEVFPAVGRTVTLNKAYPQIDREFTRLYDDWGIRVDTGGTITISTAPATEPPARTIEIWIKRNSEEVPTISVSGTTYKNGVLDATPLTVGKWTLLHIVSATDVTSNIVIGGNSQVGAVSIYPTALTATQVKEIANNYYGVKALSVDSDSIISVFEPVEGQKLYAFDWSIHAAG